MHVAAAYVERALRRLGVSHIEGAKITPRREHPPGQFPGVARASAAQLDVAAWDVLGIAFPVHSSFAAPAFCNYLEQLPPADKPLLPAPPPVTGPAIPPGTPPNRQPGSRPERMPVNDIRDWDTIRAWANGLAERFEDI